MPITPCEWCRVKEIQRLLFHSKLRQGECERRFRKETGPELRDSQRSRESRSKILRGGYGESSIPVPLDFLHWNRWKTIGFLPFVFPAAVLMEKTLRPSSRSWVSSKSKLPHDCNLRVQSGLRRPGRRSFFLPGTNVRQGISAFNKSANWSSVIT